MILFFILASGCVDTSKSNSGVNTKEFNLRTYVEYQPITPREGDTIIVKYYVENVGNKEIMLTSPINLTNMLSLSGCGNVKRAYTIPQNLIGLPYYVLNPGGSMVFVWEVQLYEEIMQESCDGNIRFGYDDKAEILKYVHVVNGDEYIYGKYKPSQNIEETFSDGNIRIRMYVTPQEPIVLYPEKQEKSKPKLIIEIENVGDGDVTIKSKRVKLNHDETINLLSCKKKILSNKKEEILKSGEKKIISCEMGFTKIPKIEEKYRVSLEIEYHVEFQKNFKINVKKSSTSLPTGKILSGGKYYLSRGCSSIRISGITEVFLFSSNDFVRKICPILAYYFSQQMISSTINYADNVYGYREGIYWGRIYGNRYSRVFAKAYCSNKNSDEVNELSCLKDVESQGKVTSECLDKLYSLVDENKVLNRIVLPRKNYVIKRIKKYTESGLRRNKAYVRSALREIYDKEISDKAEEFNVIKIGSFRIRANIDSLLRDAFVDQISKIFIDSMDNYKDEIFEKYSKGFMRGFEDGFKEGLKENLVDEIKYHCE